MGLSGRREKQRIPNDPRNLTWADNATKFGQAYMSKLGWDPSKGLGVAGDGRTSHIRVSQKLDMLGVGAANSKDPNGIAWKQNKDFEALLRRLNEDAEKKDGMILEGIDVEGSEGALEVVDEGREKHDNKRKRKDGDGASGTNKKKRKKEKDVDDSSVKKHKSKKSDAAPSRRSIVEESSSATVTTPIKIAAPRPMAHRARHIASKRLASKSASAISEILGIAPTPSSSSASPLPQTQGTLTQLDNDHTLEKLTTSTKSVADYFKDRLRTNASGSSSPLLLNGNETDNEAHDAPRGGLGSSRLRLEGGEDEQAQALRVGLGASKFGSLMSSPLLESLPTASTSEETNGPPANEGDSESRSQTVAEGTSGEKMECAKAKKDKRKLDERGRGKALSIDPVDPEDEDDDATKARQKENKSKKDKQRKDDGYQHQHLVQEQAQKNDDADAIKKRDKDARKKEKAERKAAKKAARVSKA